MGYAAGVIYYLLLVFSGDPTVDSLPVIFFVAFLMLLMAVYVFAFPKYEAGQVMTVFFGLIYVAVMLSYIYRTRVMEGGQPSGVAGFPEFLGMRYLCLLCGHADRKA